MVIHEHLATKCAGALPPMPYQCRIITQHDLSRLRVGAAREPVCGVTDDLQDSRAVQDRAVRRDIDIVLGHHLRDSGRVLCEPGRVPRGNQGFQFVSLTLPQPLATLDQRGSRQIEAAT